MLLTKIVKIQITEPIIKHYSEVTGMELHVGEIIDIDPHFLNRKSEKEVEVICDYCGKKYTTQWSGYLRSRKNFPKDSCPECRSLKTKDVCMVKYGVDNPAKNDAVKAKYRKTCLEKYGVDNAMKSKCVQDKQKQTNLEKFGTTCALMNDDVREKSKHTLLEKYGHETFMGSKIGQEIVRATMRERYGVDKPFQNKDIKEKAVNSIVDRFGEKGPLGNESIREQIANTVYNKYGGFQEMMESGMYRVGSTYVSKTQMRLYKLYGGEINKNIGKYFGDIVFDDLHIVIEYDGGGHDLAVKTGKMSQEEFDKKEKTRQDYFISHGYKVGRIVNKKEIKISDEEYLKIKDIIFDELKNNSVFVYNIE